MGDMKGRLRRLAVALCEGQMWDGTRLEDFRDALKAAREGREYTPRAGMVRAAACLRLVREACGIRDGLGGRPADPGVMADLVAKGLAAGLRDAELDALERSLARILGGDPWAT
jgi:hypothetical protein